MNEKKKHKKEKMSDEDSEWQEVINLNNCQNTESRKQIKQILDELKQIDGLVMQKICTHDLSAKLNGRVLCRICPLKQGWSGSITTGKIKRYTVNQFIEELQKAHKEMPKRPCLPLKNKSIKTQNDAEVIADLERRISKMSKNSKGVKLVKGTYSKNVTDWVSKNGYTISGETVFVNKV